MMFLSGVMMSRWGAVRSAHRNSDAWWVRHVGAAQFRGTRERTGRAGHLVDGVQSCADAKASNGRHRVGFWHRWQVIDLSG